MRERPGPRGEDTPRADMYQLYRAADWTSPPAPVVAQAVTPTAPSWCATDGGARPGRVACAQGLGEECSSHARAAMREPQARPEHGTLTRCVPPRGGTHRVRNPANSTWRAKLQSSPSLRARPPPEKQ